MSQRLAYCRTTAWVRFGTSQSMSNCHFNLHAPSVGTSQTQTTVPATSAPLPVAPPAAKFEGPAALNSA